MALLGETCGIRLPQKTVLPVILLFAFILGLGATFAEPAIGVLKSAGSSVTPWDAPLLFLLLKNLDVRGAYTARRMPRSGLQ